jgi:hypothetical protein
MGADNDCSALYLLRFILLAQRLLSFLYDQSHSTNIMYLGPAFLFAAFASLFYVPGFLDMPLSTLTSRLLISELLFAVFAVIALAALARSIELDPVWPWRPGFRRLMNGLRGRS